MVVSSFIRRCPGFVLLVGALGAVLLGGCASSRPSPTASAPDRQKATTTEQQLRAATDRWRGTPYDLGGTTLEGVDCSAFVQALYRNVLGMPLPRTTRQQANTGHSVPVEQAQPGDLVFFRPSRKSRHVGVYLGDGEFAHASTSQGVMVSRVSEAYWEDAYWMTRRILSDFSGAAPPSSTDAAPDQRGGW